MVKIEDDVLHIVSDLTMKEIKVCVFVEVVCPLFALL